MNRTTTIVLCSVLLLLGCKPSPEEQKQLDEEKRRACRDTLCPGDKSGYPEPGQTIIKLNHQLYSAPKQYVLGDSEIAFYWPSKTPAAGQGPPSPERDFYDSGIEVFLGTRKYEGPRTSIYQKLIRDEAAGLVFIKSRPRPGLEVWRGKDRRTKADVLWYVAIDRREPDGLQPTLFCYDNSSLKETCTAWVLWRPDVYARFRFSAAYGPDWPEIYDEAQRILGLIRKK